MLHAHAKHLYVVVQLPEPLTPQPQSFVYAVGSVV